MSVKSLCTAVLNETGWPTYSTLSASTDATAKQIFAIANSELRAASEYGEWPQLMEEYEFTTVADQAEYEMPANFGTGILNALYDADGYYKIRGAHSGENWFRLRYGLLSNLDRLRYKIGMNADGTRTVITLTPTPSQAMELVMAYKTNMYARASDGTEIAVFSNDSDTSKIPERLIEMGVRWRFRRAKGLDHSAELAEYNNALQSVLASSRRPGSIRVGGRRIDEDTGLTDGYVRDNGFGV